jgi:DNA-binding FadR family transcriptional regulator
MAMPTGSTNGRMVISASGGTARKLKTSETLARDVVRDILNRGLQTGDHLPSEAVMLEQYGVSRESLREGLRLLEVQGLIILRRGPGGGPIVGSVDAANLGRTSTLYYHMAGGTYAELFDAWITMEAILAERAARNADRDLVKAVLTPYLVGQTHHGSPDVDEFVSTHSSFHAVVASLAENKVLQLNLQTIGQIVTHHMVLNLDPRELRDAIEMDHRVIARAIESGHWLKARDAAEQHIRRLIDLYSERLGDQTQGYIDWR